MIRPRKISRPYLTLMPDTPAPNRSLRLLCVDDEDDIRIILELALTLDPNIEADVVASGTEMLEKAIGGGYDAFVLDAMMPGMDGYELCRRLKANDATRHVPTLFLTAKTQKDEIDRARSLGAIACLKKPFDPVTLAGDIREVLRASRDPIARSA